MNSLRTPQPTPAAQPPVSGDDPVYISVVVPTCHRNELLARCLDCLAPGTQEYPADRYEVIVTDDGSRSTAEQMVRENYPWARWVAGPRKGPASNRNNGVRLARHPWIAFTDDDCEADPAWLSSFAAAAQTGSVTVYEGRTTCSQPLTSALQDAPINETGGWLWSCNMMVRRATFETLGGFDEDFPHPHMEDVDFRERLKEGGFDFTFVPGARVEHPPKWRATGEKSGIAAECEVLYWYKHGKRGSAAAYLLPYLVKCRVAPILRRRMGKESLRALGSLAREFSYVARNVWRWEAKYRAKYRRQRAA
jgi:GT2 family glycosyltransferase